MQLALGMAPDAISDTNIHTTHKKEKIILLLPVSEKIVFNQAGSMDHDGIMGS